MTTTLDSILDRAASGMRGFILNEGAARTIHAKAAAEALVDAREHFYTRTGEIDYLGRSHDYRAFVTSALDTAGVPKAQRASVQAALRFHVSPMLRERYAEEVAKLGLEEGSTVERKRRRRGQDARLLSLFTGGGEITDPTEVAMVAQSARLAVTRVTGRGLSSPEERAEAVDLFTRLSEAVEATKERLLDED